MTHISQKAKLLTKEILKKKSEKKYGAKFSKTLLFTPPDCIEYICVLLPYIIGIPTNYYCVTTKPTNRIRW
jgi:Sec-independent protein secretion pathway component TatC